MRREDVKAVIFDQDGLMFDTERVSAIAWKIVGDRYGLEVNESFLCTIRGMNYADSRVRFFEHFGDDLDYVQFRKDKQECFEELIKKEGVPVKPGLKELLVYLKEQGIKTALATASTKEYSLRNLEEVGITSYFSCMVTGDMVEHAKPDPQVFLTAAQLMGETPEHCMVLEDSINGLEAGIRGGFITVMVPDMTQPDEAMKKRVDCICDSLFQVKELLEGEHE